MTKFVIVQQGSKRMDRKTLYGYKKINNKQGPIKDQYAFVGTWEEVNAYAEKN